MVYNTHLREKLQNLKKFDEKSKSTEPRSSNNPKHLFVV
jgi:hypothetical protein